MEGRSARPIRVAAWGPNVEVARRVMANLETSLGVAVELVEIPKDEENGARRALAEKKQPLTWDILLIRHGGQSIDAPPLELHRAFVGETGEFRLGAVLPEFEALYDDFRRTIPTARLAKRAAQIDKFVYDQALALFLVAPRTLYAVNRHVDFKPYRTSLELAETEVDARHWSRRKPD